MAIVTTTRIVLRCWVELVYRRHLNGVKLSCPPIGWPDLSTGQLLEAEVDIFSPPASSHEQRLLEFISIYCLNCKVRLKLPEPRCHRNGHGNYHRRLLLAVQSVLDSVVLTSKMVLEIKCELPVLLTFNIVPLHCLLDPDQLGISPSLGGGFSLPLALPYIKVPASLGKFAKTFVKSSAPEAWGISLHFTHCLRLVLRRFIFGNKVARAQPSLFIYIAWGSGSHLLSFTRISWTICRSASLPIDWSRLLVRSRRNCPIFWFSFWTLRQEEPMYIYDSSFWISRSASWKIRGNKWTLDPRMDCYDGAGLLRCSARQSWVRLLWVKGHQDHLSATSSVACALILYKTSPETWIISFASPRTAFLIAQNLSRDTGVSLESRNWSLGITKQEAFAISLP